MNVNRLGRCIAFGDFELYPEAGKLYKLGRRVTTARPQEVTLLTILAERAGAKVSRSELEARLWPNMKPPKNRLNVVISEAREALGDTSTEPRRYIASVGEEGYCFIHPIKRVDRALGSYEDAEATESYRAGIQCFEHRDDRSLREAVVHFKRALSRNPSNALTWVGLADAYVMMAIHCVEAPQDAFPKARAAADEALRINSSLLEPLVPLAMIDLCYLRHPSEAEETFKKVLKEKPTHPFAHNGLGYLQAATGRADEFVRAMRKAISFSPVSAPLQAFLCYGLCFTRRFDEAIIAGRKAVLAEPESYLNHECLAFALIYNRNFNEAVVHLEKARHLAHDSKHLFGYWGYACARAGLREKALLAISHLTSLPRHEYVPSYFVGIVYLGMGEHGSALDWFERAHEEHCSWEIFMNWDPVFDELREQPRFEHLLQKVWS